jgi:hypothetical protein
MPTPISASPSLSTKSAASEHEPSEPVPIIMSQPPSKPPRKLKAPTIDLTPELRRRSDPFALQTSPTFKRRNNSISPSNSFKRQRATPPQESPLATPSPSANRRNLPSPSATRKAPPSPLVTRPPQEVEEHALPAVDELKTLSDTETARPVAEIKPQPTARKRQAPLPPPVEETREAPTENGSTEEGNRKTANSQFYDISFVNNEEDSPAPSPTYHEESTFYFDHDARKEEKSPKHEKHEDPPEYKKVPSLFVPF